MKNNEFGYLENMNRAWIIAVLLCLGTGAFAQYPRVVYGKLVRLDSFPSRHVAKRNVDILLPEGYTSGKRYDVLYMHDGQMLYDSATTWNKLSWDVDDVLGRLVNSGKIREVIVVGVWNSGPGRHADYFPQKPFESLPRSVQDSLYGAARGSGASVFQGERVHSDNYLEFLVTELKPYIDQNYSTHKDRAHTFIAGSSMGGLISMYAICEYPDVFGGAACLSTHWPGVFTVENNPIPDAFFRYMAERLPDPSTHKLYFDHGNQTLDALYPPLQRRADSVLMKKGYGSANLLSKSFPGTDHSEKAWRTRLDQPLEFLLVR
jgi:predicted alpha/beta superfamily hydrolase